MFENWLDEIARGIGQNINEAFDTKQSLLSYFGDLIKGVGNDYVSAVRVAKSQKQAKVTKKQAKARFIADCQAEEIALKKKNFANAREEASARRKGLEMISKKETATKELLQIDKEIEALDNELKALDKGKESAVRNIARKKDQCLRSFVPKNQRKNDTKKKKSGWW